MNPYATKYHNAGQSMGFLDHPIQLPLITIKFRTIISKGIHQLSASIIRTLIILLCTLTASTVIAENRLIHATSPYLLQHAHNPVDWYPWGKEALQRAKKENKLIFLSIGYAACHWCHVMERESFTDPATATLLNQHFISIKVDREERPDLDGYFMDILVALTGSGGWPLSMILTPDLQPIYGGTYFPPEPAYGKPSFKGILNFLQSEWHHNSDTILKQSQQITALLKKAHHLTSKMADESKTNLQDPRLLAVEFWQSRFDTQFGGLGEGKKFPQPSILSLFLRHAAHNKDIKQAEPALFSLQQMAAGGVRDQLGGAFHRYATDRRWLIPHFEIMLYDNALLARVYLEAFQLTGEERYALIVREILNDLLSRFRQPDGCFISSLDADSAGKEGIYYTWTQDEIVRILGKDQATPLMELVFDPIDGLVEGRSVLRLLDGINSLTHLRTQLHKSRAKLLDAREQRPAPAKDDKLLSSWNGLAISAFAKAAAVLQVPSYLFAAKTCMESLNRLSGAATVGQLSHSRRADRLSSEVFLDDYAFVIQALLDLYEATFDVRHLQQARKMANHMLDHFQPASGQPFQLTPKTKTTAIPVQTVLDDGVTPAGNSIALVVLQRLALLSEDQRFNKESKAIRDHLGKYVQNMAATVPELLHAWDFQAESALEVIMIGPRTDPIMPRFLHEVQRRLIPGLVLILVEPDQKVDAKAWPLLTGRTMINNKPTVYVCTNQVCRLPVNQVDELRRQLDAK